MAARFEVRFVRNADDLVCETVDFRSLSEATDYANDRGRFWFPVRNGTFRIEIVDKNDNSVTL